jgi:hypothetical protein
MLALKKLSTGRSVQLADVSFVISRPAPGTAAFSGTVLELTLQRDRTFNLAESQDYYGPTVSILHEMLPPDRAVGLL